MDGVMLATQKCSISLNKSKLTPVKKELIIGYFELQTYSICSPFKLLLATQPQYFYFI